METQRQRDTVEFTHSLLGVNGEAEDLHRRRRDSDLEDALFMRTDLAAVTEPKGVTEYMVRASCDRLDVWTFDVCSLKCQNETAEITWLSTFDWTRRVKTIPRNTTRYSPDSLGHCESSIKVLEKKIRVFISHTWRADHKSDSDRHVAWTITQRTVNVEEQTSLTKWISKDYHGEVAKFAELSWFHSIAKQSKLAERWTDAHWVGKFKRADEQLLVTRGLTRSEQAEDKLVMKSGIWTVSKQC